MTGAAAAAAAAVFAVTTVERWWSTPRWGEVRTRGKWATRTGIRRMWTRQRMSVIARGEKLHQLRSKKKKEQLNEVSKNLGTHHYRGNGRVGIIGMSGIRRLGPVLSEWQLVCSGQWSNTG
jgi:hypothetical protein